MVLKVIIKDRIKCVIHSAEPGWKIHFMVDKNTSKIVLNNKPIKSDKQQIQLTGMNNTIQYSHNSLMNQKK